MRGQKGREYVSLDHTATGETRGRESSPTCISWEAHLQLWQARPTMRSRVLQLARGKVIMPPEPGCPGKGWSQLYTAFRHSHVPTWQPRLRMDFDGKRPMLLLGHGPRCGVLVASQARTPQWSQGHHQLLTLSCFSLPLGLQFCLSSFFCFSSISPPLTCSL